MNPKKRFLTRKKALEYLKSAQQRARTFVKKTSFDPPPIKEKEKRLTGELKNYNEAYFSEKVYSQQQAERSGRGSVGHC
jgi:glyoxylate carboligase